MLQSKTYIRGSGSLLLLVVLSGQQLQSNFSLKQYLYISAIYWNYRTWTQSAHLGQSLLYSPPFTNLNAYTQSQSISSLVRPLLRYGRLFQQLSYPQGVFSQSLRFSCSSQYSCSRLQSISYQRLYVSSIVSPSYRVLTRVSMSLSQKTSSLSSQASCYTPLVSSSSLRASASPDRKQSTCFQRNVGFGLACSSGQLYIFYRPNLS